ncbi:MAG TPA: hypothetical protein VMM18_09910 [Gemmatimonadaceae bacterium]|nr:hypothetical protein [Gemmatimonadaceae bacterium]
MKSGSILLASTATAAILFASAWHQPRNLEPGSAHRLTESVRLRAHFDSVDVELRTRDDSRLTTGQRLARAQLIAWLREYRDEGLFPRNDRFADRAMPFFRDSHGTLCAMAYLIDRSGRGDIVDDVASTRNNAFIAELIDDARLVAWLDSVGLDAAEAARIQPAYDWEPEEPVEDRGKVSSTYARTTVSLGGASLLSGLVNIYAPTRASGYLGIVAGGAALVAGATRLDRPGVTGQFAIASATVGTLAVAAAINSLRAGRATPTAAQAQARRSGGIRDVTLAPDVGWPGSAARAGITISARF